MSRWKPVRRRTLAPHSGHEPPYSDEWRRFVLREVGYDEPARERAAWWAELRQDFRRFLGGLLFGLVVFALALALGIGLRSWRTGKLDRYLPQKGEEAVMPQPVHTRDRLPADAGKPDRHVNLTNPLYPVAHPATGDDGDGTDATAADGDDD